MRREPFDLKFLDLKERPYLQELARELVLENVVLFAGAGLSFNARSKDGSARRMPNWQVLADELRRGLGDDLNARKKIDVLTVADYYETKHGRNALLSKLVDVIRDEEYVPGPVHELISKLDFKELITTNFDTLLERTFEKQYITPHVVSQGKDLTQRGRFPRIIKMNGCFQKNLSGVVITKSDFLSYSRHHPLIEVFTTKSFVESKVLFIGFSLEDPAFLAINELVVQTLGKESPRAFSLQFGVHEVEREYWHNRGVQLVDLGPETMEPDPEVRLLCVLQDLLSCQEEVTQQARRPRRKKLAELAVDILPKNALPHEIAASEQEHPSREAAGKSTVEQAWLLFQQQLGAHAPREIRWQSLSKDGFHLKLERYLKGVQYDICGDLSGEPSQGETQQIFQAHKKNLVHFLKHICLLDVQEDPGLELREPDWQVIAGILDALLEPLQKQLLPKNDSETKNDGRQAEAAWPPVDSALAELGGLVVFGALQLLILAPKWKDEGQEESRLSKENCSERLLRAISLLETTIQRVRDYRVRAAYLNLLCLVGPLYRIDEISSTWELTELPSDSVGDCATRAQDPTPEEYRLPLQGFHGVLFDRATWFAKASDSLWERLLAAENTGPRSAALVADLAHRFRYMIMAFQTMKEGVEKHEQPGRNNVDGAGDGEASSEMDKVSNSKVDSHGDARNGLMWSRLAVVGPQRRRLEKILGQIEFWNIFDLQQSGRQAGECLLNVLNELNRGWIFGTAPPEQFDQAWQAAVREAGERPQHQPWEALIIFSLAMDRDFSCRRDALRVAWRQNELNVEFLFQLIQRRMDKLIEAGPKDLLEDSACRLYKKNLLVLLRFLGERVQSESRLPSPNNDELAGSKLWDRFEEVIKEIAKPLYSWSQDDEDRRELLKVTAPFASNVVGEILQEIKENKNRNSLWIEWCLNHSSIPELLHPRQFKALLSFLQSEDPSRLHQQTEVVGRLAQALEEPGDGAEKAEEQLTWNWKLLGLVVGDLLRTTWSWGTTEQSDKPRLHALVLAAKVRGHLRLQEEVERNLSLGDDGIFWIVKDLFQRGNGGFRQSWWSRKGAFLKYLLPFVGDMNSDFISSVIKPSLAVKRLDQEGCNQAGELLAGLLLAASQDVKEVNNEAWSVRLTDLIAGVRAQEGVVGGEKLAEWAPRLTPDSFQKLQDNLISRLSTRGPVEVPLMIAQAKRVITQVEADRLAEDIEEHLVDLIDHPSEPIAEPALVAVIDLMKNEGFSARHAQRLRRTRLAVEARGGYRRTSRFAEQLANLPT